MVHTWSPTEEHDRYSDDPSYIEGRFGICPLVDLMHDEFMMGIVRIVMMPSRRPESIFTLSYRRDVVGVEAVTAKHSLWSSLNGGQWTAPVTTTIELTIDELSHPLNRWSTLREAVQRAPTIKEAIIDGKSYRCYDGVGFRHQLIDHDLNLAADWNNPTNMASNHVEQMALIHAYNEVFIKCGYPPYVDE